MGKSQRQKGYRNEWQIVQILKTYGIPAQRVPLSGGTLFAKGDIEAEIKGEKWRVEAKARANGFKQIYSWLTDNDALIIRADRKEALIVMPLRRFCEIAGEGIGKEEEEEEISS